MFPLYDLNPHRRFPWFTLAIIALNVAVMVPLSGMSEARHTQIAMKYGFMPARLTHVGQGKPIAAPLLAIDDRRGEPVKVAEVELSTAPAAVYPTFLTTMFLHGGWLHLLMNMWMLWIFGNNVEDRLGHFLFVVFYLAGGIIGTLAHWASAANGPNSLIPVVGASGAVAAVLGGYAVTYPTAKVRTLVFLILILIIDIPAVVLLGIWFVMQLFSGMMQVWGIVQPVAFWAHAGGFIAGMILMPLMSLGASPPGTDWRKESDELFRFDDPGGRRAAEQQRSSGVVE
jgi:membrane associated rhomboid family serine protease